MKCVETRQSLQLQSWSTRLSGINVDQYCSSGVFPIRNCFDDWFPVKVCTVFGFVYTVVVHKVVKLSRICINIITLELLMTNIVTVVDEVRYLINLIRLT